MRRGRRLSSLSLAGRQAGREALDGSLWREAWSSESSKRLSGSAEGLFLARPYCDIMRHASCIWVALPWVLHAGNSAASIAPGQGPGRLPGGCARSGAWPPFRKPRLTNSSAAALRQMRRGRRPSSLSLAGRQAGRGVLRRRSRGGVALIVTSCLIDLGCSPLGPSRSPG